jgi:carbamoyl-phosphate synthase small subunit
MSSTHFGPARLVLEDGTEYLGESVAAAGPIAGEVVFNTGMAGYPETLTDPSYAGQILVQTYPLIGNYGVPKNGGDARHPGSFQSSRVQVQALVVQHLSRHFSHHLAASSLEQWFADSDVPLITGIDTRALTRRLREQGTMRGWVFPDTMSLEEAKRAAREIEMHEEVFRHVAPTEVTRFEGGERRVLLIDTGVKLGILECLLDRGATVVRAPWHADISKLVREVDGVMLGNGPGDPADLDALTGQVRRLLAEPRLPVFGVCMGHQILARALGATTYKLPYGHRGVNQPVQDLTTGRCYITSQNHGYAVDPAGLPKDCKPWFSNLNDGTNEGLMANDRPVRSVQFHPEARPGPKDTEFLFDDFLSLTGALRAMKSA